MKINRNFDNLVPNYLFADVAKKTNAYSLVITGRLSFPLRPSPRITKRFPRPCKEGLKVAVQDKKY